MLIGRYHLLLDEKKRLIMPSPLRKFLKESGVKRLILTRGLDGCLFIFPEEAWLDLAPLNSKFSGTKSDNRAFMRIFYSNAVSVTLDAQGRLTIPQEQRNFANLKKEIVVIGLHNRIEVWDKEKWDKYEERVSPRYEEIAEKIEEGIAGI